MTMPCPSFLGFVSAKAIFATFVMLSTTHSALAQEVPAAPELTEHHQLLLKDVGTWTGTMKIWMAGPDADPMVMPIEEKNTKLGDGLWVLTKFEAGPFQGRGTIGYDTAKKKYVSTWIDNMSPVMVQMEGDYDEKTGSTILYAEHHDIHMKKDKFVKSVSKHTEDGGRKLEMFERFDKNGEWKKTFEINYKKA